MCTVLKVHDVATLGILCLFGDVIFFFFFFKETVRFAAALKLPFSLFITALKSYHANGKYNDTVFCKQSDYLAFILLCVVDLHSDWS